MKKGWIWLITAVSLVVLGTVLTLLGWQMAGQNLQKLEVNQEEYTAYTEEYEAGAVKEIDIQTDFADITVLTGDTEKIRAEYMDSAEGSYTIRLENGVLEIIHKEQKAWYDWIGISFDDRGEYDLILTMPKSFAGDLTITSGSGDLTVTELTNLGDLELSAASGDVELAECGAENIAVTTASGDVTAVGLTGESCSIRTSSGDVEAGRLFLAQLRVQTASGEQELSGVDAVDVLLESSSGDVEADFTAPAEMFSAEIKSSSGDVEVDPGSGFARQGDGERFLWVHTASGDISLGFME